MQSHRRKKEFLQNSHHKKAFLTANRPSSHNSDLQWKKGVKKSLGFSVDFFSKKSLLQQKNIVEAFELFHTLPLLFVKPNVARPSTPPAWLRIAYCDRHK